MSALNMEVVVQESMVLDNTDFYICIIVKLEPRSVALEIVVVASHPDFSSYVVFFVSPLDNSPIQSPTRESLFLKTMCFWINIPLCFRGCLPCVLLELTEINFMQDHTDFVCTRKEIEKVPYANTCFLLSAGIS